MRQQQTLLVGLFTLTVLAACADSATGITRLDGGRDAELSSDASQDDASHVADGDADMPDGSVDAFTFVDAMLDSPANELDASVDFAFVELDLGSDASSDAGADSGSDAGLDAGLDAGDDAGSAADVDSGMELGDDAGADLGTDAGPPSCRSGELYCGDACSVCRVEGASSIECVGDLCVPASCASGYTFVSGSCVPSTPYSFGASGTSPLRGFAGDTVYGQSVAISHDGSMLAVGAQMRNSMGWIYGVVYLYARTGASFATLPYQTLTATSPGTWFGSAVAFSPDGQTLAIGDRTMTSYGTVYLYARDGVMFESAPSQTLAGLTTTMTSDGLDNDNFGASISFSGDGDILAIGDYSYGSGTHAGSSATRTGAVQLFAKSGAVWSSAPYETLRGPVSSRRFGVSVSIAHDGSMLFVGDNDYGGDLAGGVHVYASSGGGFAMTPFQSLTGPSGSADFGQSVSLTESASTLLIGDFSYGGFGYGGLHSYTRTSATYATVPAQTFAGSADGREFGWSVAVAADASIMAVGDTIYGTDGSGAVLFFTR